MAVDTFEKQEADVLAWLLERPEIAEAVDLSLEGRDAEAKPLLVNVLQPLLAGDADVVAPEVGHEEVPSAEAREKREATTSAAEAPPAKRLASGPARTVCVVFSGLHGCGKSALANILREVLGGNWLNFDELASKAGRNSRQAFLQEFQGALAKSLMFADRDHNQRLIFVDRTHTTKAQRSEVCQELKRVKWRLRGGKVLLVDFSHSADTFGYGADGQVSKRYSDQHVSLCVSRVEERGAAHPIMHPSPKLRTTLQASAKTAEAPSPEELAMFDGRVSANVVDGPAENAVRVVEELRSLRWLEKLRSAEELRPKIEVAWQAYRRAESQWRAGAAVTGAEDAHTEWLAQCRQALEVEKARERAKATEVARPRAEEPREQVPLYWKIDLPEVSKVLTQRGILPSSFTPVEHPHTTLLYLGGADGDDAQAAKKAGLSAEQFTGMREALEALQGEEFEVKMMEIVIEENVACAIISLPPIVPCANKVPHVTLGTKPGVPPRYANEVLEEVKAGRKDGVTSIQLPTPRPLRGRVTLEFSAGD